MSNLFDPIDRLFFFEEKMLEVMCNILSGNRVVDLLLHKPRAFVNRCNFKTVAQSTQGELVTIQARYEGYKDHFRNFRGAKRFHKFLFRDKNDDLLEVIFLVKSYLQKRLKVGQWYLVNGKIGSDNKIFHPEKVLGINEVSKLSAFDARYRISGRVTNHQFSSLIARAVKSVKYPEEWLSKNSLRMHGLTSFGDAIQKLHNPSSEIEFEKACKRLAYDEILAMHLVSSSLCAQVSKTKKDPISGDRSLSSILRSRLTFALTSGQEEIIERVCVLQRHPSRMLALLQGDVGSGKTMVAIFAMLNALEAGKQAVLLSPTSVLAKQHFEVLTSIMPELKPELLIGSQVSHSKELLLQNIKSGQTKIVIATHAVLADKVTFSDLGLLVIDEQHRFGANQRTKLLRENYNADLLLVSATPIPRTIGQVLFGSITFLNLKEKPKSRPVIKTSTIEKEKMANLIERLKVILQHGSQVFWICPIIEESEDLNVISVTERFQFLKKHFGDQVDCVHGVLSAQKMEEGLTSFREGRTKILIATTVIEVGIDIPDADIIVIEDADRFGLAQLHQLRGRVGRGSKKSFCILLYDSERITENGKKRLKILRESNDGFFIAEEDFKLRGAGDILGVKQSGFYRFKFLSGAFEQSFFEGASKEAQDAMKMGAIGQYEVLIKIFFSDNNYYL